MRCLPSCCSRFPLAGRTRFSGSTQDMAVVGSVVAMLENVGAVEACSNQARELIESGWDRVSPLLEDSLAKMMLRAFGWYVLERHY